MSSNNVEWVGNIPGVTHGVGARLVDGWFYVTDQNKLMIFDVSDPELPLLTGVLQMPQEIVLGREDVDTNGTILLLPNTLGPLWGGPPGDPAPINTLYVVDVTDKRLPRIISRVPGGGGHTVACALNCSWSYTRDGPIVDLRDPEEPVLVNKNSPGLHDLDEVSEGLLLTQESDRGPALWSVREDPIQPRLIAAGPQCRGCAIDASHTTRWPRSGQDRFIIGGGESLLSDCARSSGVSSWDTTNWQETAVFRLIDVFYLTEGNLVDGGPPRNVVGCSPHWFDIHPDFHDGGLVALAAYDHGTRFLRVDGDGTIHEVGWFLVAGTSATAAYWITDELVYVVDQVRGFDILRFTG